MIKKLLLTTLLAGGLPVAMAQNYAGNELVAEFIEEMVQEHGFATEYLQELFASANKQQGILDAISRPAERVRPWKDYHPIFLTEQRRERGLAFWREHAEALERAEQQYGVPAEYIVAIIGVETMYGGNTGRHGVLDALSTLSFDYPPRAPFFRSQLREFLLLVREEQLDATQLTGSYAGAMGLPQFMPGSFRAFAVDFNDDGKIDIWTDATDAIGSVANYFVKHGWQAGEPVAVRAQLESAAAEQGLTGSLTPRNTVAELLEQGWLPEQELDAHAKATAFKLEADDGPEYWLGLQNFQTITRYNRSEMYAMAVTRLAQQLAQEYRK